MKKPYEEIVNHYLNCFKEHGDTPKGLDWPNIDDLIVRYDVMSDVIKTEENFTILDFGCGTARIFPFLLKKFSQKFKYIGLDMGHDYVKFCRSKYPNLTFIEGDVLCDETLMPKVDYTMMNGVLTEKRTLSQDEMWSYTKDLIAEVFKKTQVGMAFNVMSKNVDWERKDLFHLSLDLLTNFFCKELSRNFIIRNDYGLYEYTVYLYK